MKNIPQKITFFVLSGAYNLGDELILRSEIDFFKKKFPSSQVSVATYDENSFFGERENITFFSFFPNNFKKKFFKNIFYFWKNAFEIATSDIVVIGGGGIFFDNEPGISFKKNLLEWKIRLFWVRLFRKKVIFMGISVEVKNAENQKKLAKIFRKNDKIFPRDERSTKILESYGVAVETLYDSVFLTPPNVKNFPKKPKKIGISLRGGFWSEADISEFQKFLDFLEKNNFECIFLSHSLFGSQTHHDADFVEKNFSKKYHITRTMDETFAEYEHIDVMISMRLHATIVAANRGIPVVMIPYGPKTLSLAEILGIEKTLIDTEKFSYEEFLKKFNYLYNNYENEQEKISALYREIHTKFLQKIEKTDIMATNNEK